MPVWRHLKTIKIKILIAIVPSTTVLFMEMQKKT